MDQLAAAQQQRLQDARQRAAAIGLPLRITRPNGATQEIAGFDDDGPLYRTTHNANAAISTAANVTRTSYAVDGNGTMIGLWDGGSARATHQEFGGRIVVKDGAGSIDHATHVAGTLAAVGLNANARGMASAATVDCYDWNGDVAEMTSRGASAPGQVGKIYLSNHSYGYISGWNYVNDGTRVWEWYGNGTGATGAEQDFGRYNTYARDQDALAASAPYYLIFRSAGNERVDNPAEGETVALSPGGATVVAYDPVLHPAGDGGYHGGFENISYEALAKNVMTVGSTTDAVTSGARDITKANSSSFSSWGPTDDGRIKPDIVANGDGVYSSLNGSNAAYGTYSGTSMSTPNATGSAALLVQLYGSLFPGQAMRASTLKGLLIHTADDLGNPGPDYRYGWGLVNTKTAADLIADHQASPVKQRITESSLSSSILTRTQSIVWDGVSPIRATLCWTDPAGVATTTSDLRTARLVNNLNLKLSGPGGSEHLPYVMPFIGSWTQASMDSAAVTGINNTDNVEQVLVSTPPAAGIYQVIVSFSGSLTNTLQRYSLVLSGTAPSGPLPPAVFSVTPDSTESGSLPLAITGSGFVSGAAVKLTLAGQPDVIPAVTSITPTTIACTLNTGGMASGLWNIVVTNPDNQSGTLNSAFAVIGTIWSQNFDPTAPGWTASANIGVSNWALVTSQSQSPSSSWFASGPATKNTDNLVSETINIPANTSRLKLSFWHKFNLESSNDGGVLEFSINNGVWFSVTNSGTAEAITSGEYNTTLSNPNGNPNAKNEFAGKPAWSGNSGGSFTEVVVTLTDTAKYAGKSLRARWRLGTNGSVTSSGGWFVDSVKLKGAGGLVNQAPSIVSAASATPSPVVAVSTNLTVSAGDDGGESALTYTWSATGGTFERPVSFSDNGNNAAKLTTATFTIAGTYTFQVTVRDAAGATATSNVEVVVEATASQINVSPPTANLVYGDVQNFAATVLDQFGDSLAPQPSITWGANGGGSFGSPGVFTTEAAGGPYTITASSGVLSGNATMNISKASASVSLGSLSQIYNASPHIVTASTTPPGLSVQITYDGSPTAPTNAGSYAIVATISNSNYQGSNTGTLEIAKAPATIDLIGLSQTYDGSPKPITAVTVPENLTVSITYDGSSTAPTNAGTYAIAATITAPNYLGSATGSLVIHPGNDWSSWQTLHFTETEKSIGLAGDNADPDFDNLPNLAEYALGADPRQFTPPLVATLDETSISLVFTRPPNLPGITYHPESTDEFGTWTPAPLELITPGNPETLRARTPLATEEPYRRFLRLRFERE